MNPDLAAFEVVERKFRGHPDSLADMVAQAFSKKYIEYSWERIPELQGSYFPNFSADKITLSGSSSNHVDETYQIIKPIDALLIGKITASIGNFQINTDQIFKESIEEEIYRANCEEDKKHGVDIINLNQIEVI